MSTRTHTYIHAYTHTHMHTHTCTHTHTHTHTHRPQAPRQDEEDSQDPASKMLGAAAEAAPLAMTMLEKAAGASSGKKSE